jgi:hypothetical protein
MNLSYLKLHRHSLDSWMECTPSSLLTTSLYTRLVILGLVAFILSATLSVRDLASQITVGSAVWPGWNVVHADFGRVDEYPRAVWAAQGRRSGFGAEVRRWVSVACALAAFFVLGTTREAGERYAAFGRMILRALGGKSGQQGDDASADIKRHSGDVVKAYYTHEEIVLPIIKKHNELFPPPSPTTSTPSLASTPPVSRTPSVKVQQQPPSLSPPMKVPEPKLSPYGPSYGTRSSIRPEDVGRRERTPPTPTSPGFASGDMLGALLSSSYKNKGKKDGKKEKVMPKVLMTPF